MCGIAGFYDTRSRDVLPDGEARLKAQIETLLHRGPDATKVHSGPGVGLAHSRLAIIDLSESANQPMTDASRKIHVVYNGEIYNFQDIRRDLEARGCSFRTKSDTEVVVEGYRVWGIEVVNRLRGMFSMALWDQPKDRLILIRDRVGKKPLYYGTFGGTLVFGSEIKAIRAWPGVPREPNLDAIHAYLTYQYVPSPMTAFRGICKLPPGCLL
ncbi:MAG: asparagine synthetase B, partial [Hyphomicrobiaceae bacterium]